VAAANKFAIRFRYTATVVATGKPVTTDVIYFYHLRDEKVAELWLLADFAFDYRSP
jgi:ketosteroid isomerase-like protein